MERSRPEMVTLNIHDYETTLQGNYEVFRALEQVWKSMGIVVHRTDRELQRWGVERVLEFRDDYGNVIGMESTDIRIDWEARRSNRYYFEMDQLTHDGVESSGWLKTCIAQKIVITVPQEKFFCRVDMTELRSFCDAFPGKEKTEWKKTALGNASRGITIPRSALARMNSYWDAQWR